MFSGIEGFDRQECIFDLELDSIGSCHDDDCFQKPPSVQQPTPADLLENYRQNILSNHEFNLGSTSVFSGQFRYFSEEMVMNYANSSTKELKLLLDGGAVFNHDMLSRLLKQNCSFESLKLIIQYAANRKEVVNYGYLDDHPLYIALQRGRFDILPYLLFYGADLENAFSKVGENSAEVIDKKIEQLIWDAAEEGKISLFKFLVSIGFPIDLQDNTEYPNGVTANTALHYAALRNRTILGEFLIGRGADPFIKNKQDETYWNIHDRVLEQRDENAKRALLAVIQNPNNVELKWKEEYFDDISCFNEEVDIEGNTLLHLAMRNCLKNPRLVEIVARLVEKGANLECLNEEGDEPLDCQPKDVCEEAKVLLAEIEHIKTLNQDAFRKLLNWMRTPKPCLPLLYISKLDIIKINVAIDDKGNTLLHEFALKQFEMSRELGIERIVSVFRELIERGANPYQKNKEGLTPLALIRKASFEFRDPQVCATNSQIIEYFEYFAEKSLKGLRV